MGNRFSVSLEAPHIRPRTRCRFSASLEAGSATIPSPPPRPISLTEHHVQLMRPTTPAMSAGRRLDIAERLTKWESHQHHAVRDGTGQGLPAAVLGTMPTTDTCTALCYLTPALRTAWHGESSPGPCSLGINKQDQLLPPSLGYPLLGSCSLETRAHRAPHDSPASASTGPRHVAHRTRHTLR